MPYAQGLRRFTAVEHCRFPISFVQKGREGEVVSAFEETRPFVGEPVDVGLLARRERKHCTEDVQLLLELGP